MKNSKWKMLSSLLSGFLLIAVGVVILLSNLDIITLNWNLITGPLMAAVGVVFLIVFVRDRASWWALLPGFALIGIGVIVSMSEFMGNAADRWGGMIFLGMLSLAFLSIYISHRENWWAVIPGGVLLTLAVVTLFPDDMRISATILFFGLALTFALVYVLPNPAGKLTWALYPAGILALVGILALIGATSLMNYIWPVGLLLTGVYVIYRSVRN